MKIFMQLDGDPRQVAENARQLQDLGADGMFTFEGRHDVMLPLAMAAGAGSGLAMMTNVAIALPRSPLHLAHAAWDLQLVSEGRFRLGLGSQTKPHIERRYGSTWSRPVARMRETVVAVKEILQAWEEERAPRHEGEFSTHTLTNPNFVPGPHPFGPPPVFLGALGPKMTRAAAEVADGLLVMPFNSRRHLVERTVAQIEAGLADSGRKSSDFEVIPQVVVAMGATPDRLAVARDGARRLLAFYASTPAYTSVLEVEGWADAHHELLRLAREQKWTEMSAALPAGAMDTIGVSGAPGEAARAVLERFEDLAETVCCYFPGYEPASHELREFIETLQRG